MKRFTRSIPGKTALFLLTIIMASLFMGAIVGVVYMAEYGIYSVSEQNVFYRQVNNLIIEDGFSLLVDEFYDDTLTENSNLYFRVSDWDGNVISDTNPDLADWDFTYDWALKKDEYGNVNDIVNLTNWYADEEELQEFRENGYEFYTIDFSLKDGLPENDHYATAAALIHFGYTMRYAAIAIGIIALILGIVCLIVLLCSAGRSVDTDELCPGPLFKVPFDLILAGACLLGYLLLSVCHNLAVYSLPFMVAVVGTILIGLSVGLGLVMGAAVRIKAGMFIRNTVIAAVLRTVWKICRWFGSLIVRIPLVAGAVAVIGVLMIWNAIVLLITEESFLTGCVLWLIGSVVMFVIAIWFALGAKSLQKDAEALASGDLEHKTDISKLPPGVLRIHGEYLNSIADAMKLAVNEQMRSERMKTELITNVSHDLKTPLTSIVNYAALIGNEPCENPRITEYSEVLVRQSKRLKRLIEDLVEASRASSGALDVELAPCDAGIFLTQAGGEYEEKLQQAGLTLVAKTPEQEMHILADGRRMRRIFDNLMSNICKYAQEGTRVYLTLEQMGKRVVFTFKNTSRDALDISEEELMERFVRGDASRNTEGNGLGLSIAKSLAELQGGNLQLQIDGDLFKAVLSFPIIEK